MAVKILCPYCGIGIQPISKSHYHLTGRYWKEHHKDDLYYKWVHLGECPYCRQHIIVITDGEALEDCELIDYQPKLYEVTASEFIPQNIREDFIEAKRCLQINAIKAAATMSRRALQSSAFEKGAPDKRLIEQLKWMFEQGIITKSLYNLAEKIRIIGNDAAHPSRDGIDEVKKEEAETIVKFLEKYLDHVYITPREVEELEKKEASQ